MASAALYFTPLCPAGHLPLKGGDWQLQPWRFIVGPGDWRKSPQRRISPLEGEMSGRTEGGAIPPTSRSVNITDHCHAP